MGALYEVGETVEYYDTYDWWDPIKEMGMTDVSVKIGVITKIQRVEGRPGNWEYQIDGGWFGPDAIEDALIMPDLPTPEDVIKFLNGEIKMIGRDLGYLDSSPYAANPADED